MSSDLLAIESPIAVGDLVDKYRVERILGIGAMGVVAAARHTQLDQVVAIKLLVEHRYGSAEESIARFLGEARAAARIGSDHVCRVSDIGQLPNGTPYMVMEYLEGNDLEEELETRGQLGVGETVDFVLQALDAIAAAHALGIVHRDLKPANLFLARRPDGSRRVKVLDFGISKGTTGGASSRFTGITRSLGTPAYMPPEQIRDPKHVDHRADIWSLGAILYELLTGQMAFAGENVKVVLDRVLEEDPCPIPSLRGDVPIDLVTVVVRALTRDRDHRWQTAGTFAQALAPFGSPTVFASLPSIVREVGVGHIHAAAPAPQPQPQWEELSRRHAAVQDWTALQGRRRRAQAVVLGMLAALLFGAAGVILIYRSRVARRAPPEATTADGTDVGGAAIAAASAPPATGVQPASTFWRPRNPFARPKK